MFFSLNPKNFGVPERTEIGESWRTACKPGTLMHEAGVIIGQQVDASSEPAAVAALLQQHRDVFGTLPPTLLLDAGYHHGPPLGAVAEQGIDVLCPSGKAMGDEDWEKRGAQGRFAENQFRYHEADDAYECPAHQVLRYVDHGTDGRGRGYRRYRTVACAACPLRAAVALVVVLSSHDGAGRWAATEFSVLWVPLIWLRRTQ